MNDLSSIENVFNEKYLEKVNRNICEYTIEKGEYREINLIKGYIAVRIRRDYEKINSTLCIDDQNQLLVFKGRFYNKQMADVYNLLISGEVTRIDNTDIVDSMGLSPLHYAFVLKEKDICNELLETGKWYDYEAPYQSGELKEIYNYLVVADLLEYEDLAYVFRFTSREAQSIMDTCQKIDIRIRVKEERIKGKKEAIKANKYKANEARKADDRETYERAIERIEELEDDINSTEELVREWQEELENLNTELELITENAIANAKEWKERLVNSQTSMVQFLLKMFFDKDFLFQCISGEDAGWAVYEFEKFRFILPKDIKFWERDAKAKKENYEQKENNKTVKKPYGDSWFSVEAHWDLKILKKEYRKLIKEYHPDNGSINQFIIQEIILEKAEILKNIEN